MTNDYHLKKGTNKLPPGTNYKNVQGREYNLRKVPITRQYELQKKKISRNVIDNE